MTTNSINDETLGTHLVVSPSLQEFNSADENSDELKQTIESLSPRVSALLDADEAAIDYLLCENKDVYVASPRLSSTTTKEFDDGIASEWNRLSVLEQSLSEELELSALGWRLNDAEFLTVTQDQTSTFEEDLNHGKNPSSLDLLIPLAEAIQAQFSSEDVGLPTISFLSTSDIQAYKDTPVFESHQNTVYTIEQWTQATQSLLLFVREYILPLSDYDLNSIFVGTTSLHETRVSEDDPPASTTDHRIKRDHDEMSIRTVTIRIRPDILCGAVMDAVQASIQNLNGEITKRQGGHLRAMIPRLRVLKDDKDGSVSSLSRDFLLETSYISEQMEGRKESGSASQYQQLLRPDSFLPSICLDIQLVSKRRSREIDRTLLIRTFKGKDTDPSLSSLNVYEINIADIGFPFDTHEHRLIDAATSVQKLLLRSSKSRAQNTSEPTNRTCHDKRNPKHLSSWKKRAHYIAQELKKKSPLLKGKLPQDSSIDTTAIELMKDLGADSHNFIQDQHTPKPTCKCHMPILEHMNLPYFAASKCFIMTCLHELESRGLSHSSLSFLPFCKFPALSTLCPHYCSQIRDITRLSMLTSLLKSSKELDAYVSDTEFWTTAMTEVLKSRFDLYNLDLPLYPQPTPLAIFPLDFHAPEVSSPPWGPLVGETINHLPTFLTSYQGKTEFDKARDVVVMISSAFQAQADEEFTKRLSRKNFQVIDRLGKLQAFRRTLVECVKGSHSVNKTAAENAARFQRYAERAQGASSTYALTDRVPLLECNITMGAYTGLCLITAYEMLLSTRLMPVVGEKKYDLVSLADIEVSLTPVSGSHLWDPTNCLPHSSSGICVSRQGDDSSILFSFKPAIQPAVRFKAFIDMLKESNCEKGGEIRLSSSSGLLSLLEEHDLFIRAALGNEA